MTGKLALVVGAGSGIGFASAALLAARGWTLASADIDRAAAEAVLPGLAASGHRAYAVDVRDEASVAAMFTAAERDLGPVVAMVCCAGGTHATQAHRPRLCDTSANEWTETFALNALGSFLCVREYLRRRRLVPVQAGRVVLLSSIAAQVPGSPTGIAYAAAKAAILALARGAAHEAAGMGITVNAIAPGAIDTPAFRRTVHEADRELAAAATPVGRLGTAEDVAAAVAFLLSPEAAFVTGSTMDVNGGRRMQ